MICLFFSSFFFVSQQTFFFLHDSVKREREKKTIEIFKIFVKNYFYEKKIRVMKLSLEFIIQRNSNSW